MKCTISIVLLIVLEQVLLSRANDVALCSCPKRFGAKRNVTSLSCDPGVRLDRLQISPVTSPGKLEFKFKIELDKTIFDPRMEFVLTKDIHVPCIHGLGSCAYSLCGGEEFALEEKICAAWGCQCPLRPGIYNSGSISIDLPDLSFIGSHVYGPLAVKLKLREGNQVLHCVSLEINVERPAHGDFDPSLDNL